MGRRGLTSEWSLDLDDSFDSRMVDDDLQLMSLGPPVRTIWVAVWSPPADLSPQAVRGDILKDVYPAPLQRFHEGGADADEIRYASWYEEVEGGQSQWGLYAYTIRRGSYVQIALLSDDSADLDWALTTWRSVRFDAAPAEG